MKVRSEQALYESAELVIDGIISAIKNLHASGECPTKADAAQILDYAVDWVKGYLQAHSLNMVDMSISVEEPGVSFEAPGNWEKFNG